MQLATGPYQLLDPLTPEEFAALEADILERGVMVAIEFDEDGNVIDGHHRYMICQKHGITDYPSVIRRGWTEQQKRAHSRKSNLFRRHLTRERRRELIEDQLRETPADSDRAIAKSLGVDHKTVGAARRELEGSGEIPHLDQRTGINGKPYISVPRVYPPSVEVVDANGEPVPERLIGYFKLAGQFVTVENLLMQACKVAVETIGKTPKPDAGVDRFRRGIEELKKALSQNVPHAIHSACGGAGCKKCSDRGYLTRGEIPHPKKGLEVEGPWPDLPRKKGKGNG